MRDANVDTFFQGKAFGPVAQRLVANGMNAGALRPWEEEGGDSYINVNGQLIRVNASTLRKDEWKDMDQAVLKAAQQRLIGVTDLNSRGLTYNISNGLGTTVLEYENLGDISDAEMNMDAVTRGRDDRPKYDIAYLPLPVIHKSFHFNIRALAASRTSGAPLDTTMAEMCGRMVAEKVESILFNGSGTFAYGGGTIYGYTDFPSRLTGSLTAAWDASAATGATMLTDLRAMKQASIDARHYGPWVVYIPTSYETALDADFKAASDKTIRERLLEVGGILDIKVADFLSTDCVLMVQMTSNVVRMVNGLGITPVEWDSEGGMVFHYKVMTIQVPQLRADQNSRTGIVHYSEP